MSDPTESIRREMVAEINAEPGSRAALEAKHGQVWDTDQLRDEFEVDRLHGPVRRRPSQIGRRQRLADVPAQSEVLLRVPARVGESNRLGCHGATVAARPSASRHPIQWAEETKMTEKNNDSLSTVLKDVESRSSKARCEFESSQTSLPSRSVPKATATSEVPRGTDAPCSWNFIRAGSGWSSSPTSTGKIRRTSSTSKMRGKIGETKPSEDTGTSDQEERAMPKYEIEQYEIHVAEVSGRSRERSRGDPKIVRRGKLSQWTTALNTWRPPRTSACPSMSTGNWPTSCGRSALRSAMT